MGTVAHTFSVQDEEVAKALADLIVSDIPLGWLGRPFQLKDSDLLYFNPDCKEPKFPEGALLIRADTGAMPLQNVQKEISDYLGAHADTLCPGNPGKLAPETLFKTVVKYEGLYFGNSDTFERDVHW
ncbi:hypothetical protein KY360_04385 [Candidatus Woesearchaeota archaeon]|nr:hypothetical protein [Candidatus Woesearchaeota archaeon]